MLTAKFSTKMDKRKKALLLGGFTTVVLVIGGAAAVSGGALTQMNPPANPVSPLAPPNSQALAPSHVQPPIAPSLASATPLAAPAPQVTPAAAAPQSAPFTGAARLGALDSLHADIEQTKLEVELAELRAKKREAESGVTHGGATASTGGAPASLPPMPAFPAGGINTMMPVSLDTPPVPPSRRGSSAGAGQGAVNASTGGGTQFLEAWGSGKDVQARVMTADGERIVRIGDTLPGGGRVVGINGNTLTITDVRGKSRTFN